MSNLSISDNYKKIIIERQLKIFSYYLAVGFFFSAIFGMIFLFEKIKQPPIPETPVISYSSDNIIVKQGHTLQQILSEYGISYTELMAIIDTAKPKLDLTRLNVGQNITVRYETSPSNHKVFQAISFKTSPHERVIVEKVDQGYKMSISPIMIQKTLAIAGGKINDNVITSALKAGVPLKNIMEFIGYYSYTIDFQRDLRAGDKFNIVYEKLTSEEEGQSSTGKTVFANLILSGKEHKMYRFKLDNGHEDFFDDNNSSIKKPLLKTPVQSARISSKFGLRKHPILGYSLMHRGIDFAAAPGTPIYAAGSGTVVEIGHKGSYGRYIKIKHNNELYTAYAHARGYAKGLKRGSKVSQGDTIAYVGASGRASGPHLHYEIIHRGKQIDPLKFKVPSYLKLKGTNLEKFKERKMELDNLLTGQS